MLIVLNSLFSPLVDTRKLGQCKGRGSWQTFREETDIIWTLNAESTRQCIGTKHCAVAAKINHLGDARSRRSHLKFSATRPPLWSQPRLTFFLFVIIEKFPKIDCFCFEKNWSARVKLKKNMLIALINDDDDDLVAFFYLGEQVFP